MFEDLFKKLEGTKYLKVELDELERNALMINDYLKSGNYAEVLRWTKFSINVIYSSFDYQKWSDNDFYDENEDWFAEMKTLDYIYSELMDWYDTVITDIFKFPCVRSYFEEKCGIKEAKNE